jgi:hypothetical protein
MAHVHIDKTKLGEAFKYANLIRNAAKRRYANEYIAWLQNGAEGLEPEHNKISYMAAQAVRMTIADMKLWD